VAGNCQKSARLFVANVRPRTYLPGANLLPLKQTDKHKLGQLELPKSWQKTARKLLSSWVNLVCKILALFGRFCLLLHGQLGQCKITGFSGEKKIVFMEVLGKPHSLVHWL
jgi:hypothetical protein